MTQRVEVSGTQRITYTQEWDAGHRLMVVTATVGGVTRFADDGDGTRVQQVHASGITLYLGAVELTLSPTGRITRTYYFVHGQRIALREQRSDGMVVYFLHNDALGSAALGTGLTGTVVSSLRYTLYGLPREEAGRLPTPYRYTGQREMGVGFYDYQARLYDPAVGRFISADSIVPGAANGAGGAAATPGYDAQTRLTPLTVNLGEFVLQVNAENREILQLGPFFQWDARTRQEHHVPMGPANPQALNRYAYGLNNPLKYVDPTGHDWIHFSVYLRADEAAQLISWIDNVNEYNVWGARTGFAIALISAIQEATGTTIVSAASIELITKASIALPALPTGLVTFLSALIGYNSAMTFEDFTTLRNSLSDLKAQEYGAYLELETTAFLANINTVRVTNPNGERSWRTENVGFIGSMACFPIIGHISGYAVSHTISPRHQGIWAR